MSLVKNLPLTYNVTIARPSLACRSRRSIDLSKGTAEGGGSETDPELTVLSLLSDSAGGGGYSGTGDALGGAAGNVL